jgi:hypothetical protein
MTASEAEEGQDMPEGRNVEVAHKLSEQEHAARVKYRWEELTEILEVLVLAIAAIATAWSGYQAARGDGHQSVLYGESSRDRFQAAAPGRAGPPLHPEYRSAFEAWLKTDPFTDPAAPPGPGYMPGQRFRVRGVGIGVNALAVGLLVYGLVTVSTLPRL